MSIVILGSTTCKLCGKIIQEGDEYIAFPSFVLNQTDPLWKFNNSIVHLSCLRDEPYGEVALDMLRALKESLDAKICQVCGLPIKVADDFFTFGYLTSDRSSPVFEFNFLCFHIQHIRIWSQRLNAIERFKILSGDPMWDSKFIEDTLSVLY